MVKSEIYYNKEKYLKFKKVVETKIGHYASDLIEWDKGEKFILVVQNECRLVADVAQRPALPNKNVRYSDTYPSGLTKSAKLKADCRCENHDMFRRATIAWVSFSFV